MDLEVLRKKISTFRTENGRLRITDDQMYLEILLAWEQWPGQLKEFYRAIGVSKSTMAAILGKAKRLRREGHFPAEAFKEIRLEPDAGPSAAGPCNGVELLWEGGRIIRFSEVEKLIDFLKKVS
ncbi:MAG: hypothetical protein N2578_01405 [Bdellovibrionaceae bacterium]|nr:hypothetical protein [Pseudobdellovibrionaceae bacterium]